MAQETTGVYGVFFRSPEVQDTFLRSIHCNTKRIQIIDVDVGGYFRGELMAPWVVTSEMSCVQYNAPIISYSVAAALQWV